MAMDYITITSNTNQVIKEIRELSDKKGRTKHGAFILEGLRLVEEAMASSLSIRYFTVAEGFIQRFETMTQDYKPTKVYRIPDELFKKLSETESPQGIMAIADIPVASVEEVLRPLSRCVILENVQDPGNMGTIIRTADACGFDAVILSKGSVDPFNAKVLRSTMGSLFHLPVVVADDLFALIDSLKTKGIQIVAAHPRDSKTLWDAPLKEGIGIVIGNEGNGLTDRMLETADFRVSIPMPGKAESLNASAAAAMLLYESMRQNNVSL